MNALLVAALMAIHPVAQDQGRVAQVPASTRVATIKGRVTERDSGQPLSRFRVSLSIEPLYSENTRTVDTVLTDTNGAYQFSAVQPGQYLITARPPEYVATHLPQTFGYDNPLPTPGSARLKRVQVRAGDTIDADITVSRSLAIEGRVMTAEGDPLANLNVSVERLDRRADRPAVTTDDRGFYRHYGLPPGRYRVCATPAAPDPATEASGHETAPRACYPDAAPAGTATIDVTAADARNADIVMRRGVRFTISGTVFDSAGASLAGGEMSCIEERGRSRRSLKVERPHPGNFLIRDIEPGTYVLRADVRPQVAAGLRGHEFAVQEIVVDRSDITGVVLRTRRLAIVSGMVTFEGGAPETGIDRMVVTVQRQSTSDAPAVTVVASHKVRANSMFELAGTVEPVRLQLSDLPSGWVVKSILYRGRDVAADAVVLEASDDPRAIEITLTNRVAFLTGSVAGAAPTTVVVLAIRADKVGGASSGEAAPVAAAALLDERRGFKLGPLEPGDYYVAAVDRNQWFDVSVRDRSAGIASLIVRAERVAVVEGDQPPMALRVVPVK